MTAVVLPGHYATNREVAGAIPAEVIGVFNWPNPSSRIVRLVTEG
jgi:hypothetical protein